jgi:dCMP deaminase
MKSSFFRLARQLAKYSHHPDYQFGAVVVKGSRVVSVGCNKYKTHPKAKSEFNRIHAELGAILNAKTDLTGATIYVYRETRHGIPALARPCKHCQAVIKAAGIKKMYYSGEGEYCYEHVKS